MLNQINNVCPSSKIYMTGYPTPTKDFKFCQGLVTTAGTSKLLNNPIKAACDRNAKCTYDDATARFGSTDGGPSSGEFHLDSIHLNEKGYCKLWSTDTFRSTFKCTNDVPCRPTFKSTTPRGVTGTVTALSQDSPQVQ